MITVILTLILISSVNAVTYEINIDKNTNTLSDINELDYSYLLTDLTIQLYNAWDNSLVSDITFKGEQLYNESNEIDAIFWGNISLSNILDDMGGLLTEEVYNGICIIQDYNISCIITNGINTYVVGGNTDSSYSRLNVVGYEEIQAVSGYSEQTEYIADLGNLSANGFGILGLGNNLFLAYGNLTLTDSDYNGEYKGACYYINNDTWNVLMSDVKCFGYLNNYIDYDNDGFYSDVDCNDNNDLINPYVIEIGNNMIDENCDEKIENWAISLSDFSGFATEEEYLLNNSNDFINVTFKGIKLANGNMQGKFSFVIGSSLIQGNIIYSNNQCAISNVIDANNNNILVNESTVFVFGCSLNGNILTLDQTDYFMQENTINLDYMNNLMVEPPVVNLGSSGGGGGGSDSHPAVVTSTPIVTEPVVETPQETQTEDTNAPAVTGAATTETGNGNLYISLGIISFLVLITGFFVYKKYF